MKYIQQQLFKLEEAQVSVQTCQKCNSENLAHIEASEQLVIDYKDRKYVGKVPMEIELGNEEGIEFTYCINCGQIQGTFPITDEDMLFAMDEQEEWED